MYTYCTYALVQSTAKCFSMRTNMIDLKRVLHLEHPLCTLCGSAELRDTFLFVPGGSPAAVIVKARAPTRCPEREVTEKPVCDGDERHLLFASWRKVSSSANKPAIHIIRVNAAVVKRPNAAVYCNNISPGDRESWFEISLECGCR